MIIPAKRAALHSSLSGALLFLYISGLSGCFEYCLSLNVLQPHDLTYSENFVSVYVFSSSKVIIKNYAAGHVANATKIHWFSALLEGEVLRLLVLWVFYCNSI